MRVVRASAISGPDFPGRIPCGLLLSSVLLLSLALLSVMPVAAFAADVKLRVVDPNSAAVPGAQVSIFLADESTPLATAITAGDGTATLASLSNGSYRVEVLAPGFTAYSADV